MHGVKRKAHGPSLKRRILLGMALVGLMPFLVLGLFSLFRLDHAIRVNSEKLSMALSDQMRDNFDRWLTNYEYESFNLAMQNAVQTYLSNPYSNAQYRHNYNKAMMTLIASRSDIVDSAVYRPDGVLDSLRIVSPPNKKSLYLKGADITSPDFYDRMGETVTEARWFSRPVFENLKMSQNKRVFEGCIALCRNINSFDTGERLGVLIWHIDAGRINTLMRDATLPGGYVLAVTPEGYVINRDGDFTEQDTLSKLMRQRLSSPAGYFELTLNSVRYMVSYSTSRVTGWRLVNMIPESQLKQELFDYRALLGGLTVGLTVLVAVGAVIMAHWVFKPIGRLAWAIDHVDYERFRLPDMEISGGDEIARLSYAFKDMLGRIQALVQQRDQEHDALKRAELQALQSQINPHFLYNTLDSAAWIAKGAGITEIADLMVALARFYRISLSDGLSEIPIEREIEHVKNYLHIEAIRYGDKFSVEYDLDERVNRCYIIKIVLQPLVENSLRHGVRGKPGKGKVRLTTRLEGNEIFLMVEDDGLGMENERVQMLLSAPASTHDARYGYGLANVNDRLVMRYGAGHGLNIESEPGRGTRVWMCIPAENTGEGQG
jgi:two-component system sensor histidine kinase YesM